MFRVHRWFRHRSMWLHLTRFGIRSLFKALLYLKDLHRNRKEFSTNRFYLVSSLECLIRTLGLHLHFEVLLSEGLRWRLALLAKARRNSFRWENHALDQQLLWQGLCKWIGYVSTFCQANSPKVFNALPTSQEKTLIEVAFKLRINVDFWSMNSSPMRSNKFLLITVTGEPVYGEIITTAIIAVAMASFTLIGIAISLHSGSYTSALAVWSVSVLTLLTIALIRTWILLKLASFFLRHRTSSVSRCCSVLAYCLVFAEAEFGYCSASWKPSCQDENWRRGLFLGSCNRLMEFCFDICFLLLGTPHFSLVYCFLRLPYQGSSDR